jgi:iron(III) transport system substrate-binding protein
MQPARIAIFLLLALIIGVPYAMRPPAEARRQLRPDQIIVVLTPHVPQIQREFSAAFDAWHRRVHGSPAHIDWRQPGGTSEIMKVLEAHYQAAAKAGAFTFSDPANPAASPGATAYDLMLGGGSYEFGRLKQGVRLRSQDVPGAPPGEVVIPMSAPAPVTQAQLDEWFGENTIGAGLLYDPDRHWLGTALSGFGIVYNRDAFARLGLPEPTSFEDLASPALRGELALADPRQSGSVTTTYDAILSYYGWEKGWGVLRAMCGNARYFANSSPKPPIDVSHGEAAAGLAIDFYGRGQGQAVLLPGQDPREGRVGYVDPRGATYIDADPVAMLRGGPNPALAARFVEFCLSDEAQALWQFRALEVMGRPNPKAANNPKGPDGQPMGPRNYELRRMPVRREMYQKYAAAFVDDIHPFESATTTKPAGWRSAIPIMMGAFGIDNARECRAAWARVLSEPDPQRHVALEAAFHSFPTTTMPDGSVLEFTQANYRAIAIAWRDPAFRARCEIEYTQFFLATYRTIATGGDT